MASILCPKCSKRVEFSDDGKCPNCGYIMPIASEVSPFTPAAEPPHVSYDDKDDDAPKGSTPVVALDPKNKPSRRPVDPNASKPKPLLGIGLCRIFAYISSIVVLVSSFLPYAVFTLKEEGETLSDGLPLITSGSLYGYAMLIACLVSLFFAFRGKPAMYLLCTVVAAAGSALCWLYADSFVDVMKISVKSVIRVYMAETGVTDVALTTTHGAGFYVMFMGIGAMVVVALLFLANHRAYDG